MKHWELIEAQERDGFVIELHFAPETDAPEGHFATGDDDADAELCARIRNGDLLWFVARVTVRKAGIELGSDYLGGCCYESAESFVNGDYYPDMIEAAIEQAALVNG